MNGELTTLPAIPAEGTYKTYGEFSSRDIFRYLSEENETRDEYILKEAFYTEEQWKSIVKELVDKKEIFWIGDMETGGPGIVSRAKTIPAEVWEEYSEDAKKFEKIYLNKLYFNTSYEDYALFMQNKCPKLLGQSIFSEKTNRDSRDLVTEKMYRPPFLFDTLYSEETETPFKLIEPQCRGYGYLDEFDLIAQTENAINPSLLEYNDGIQDALDRWDIVKSKLTNGQPLYVMDSNPLTGGTCNDQIPMAQRLSGTYPLAPINLKSGEINIYEQKGSWYCKILDTEWNNTGEVAEMKYVFNRMIPGDIKQVGTFFLEKIAKKLDYTLSEPDEEFSDYIGQLLISDTNEDNENTEKIADEISDLRTLLNFFRGLTQDGARSADILFVQGPHVDNMITKDDNGLLLESEDLGKYYSKEYRYGATVTNTTNEEKTYFYKPTDGASGENIDEVTLAPGESFSVAKNMILQEKIYCKEQPFKLLEESVSKKYEVRAMFYPWIGEDREGQLGVAMGRVGLNLTNHLQAIRDARALLNKKYTDIIDYKVAVLTREDPGKSIEEATKEVVTKLILYGEESIDLAPCMDLGVSRIIRK